jgi:hypothetical protein
MCTVGALCLVFFVYLKIRTGHGADPFQNGYGQFETWASYAGSLVGGLLILLGGVLVGGWQLWRRSRAEGVPTRDILKELKRGR